MQYVSKEFFIVMIGTSPAKTVGFSANCDSKCYWHVSYDKINHLDAKWKCFYYS
jgi:hypothetical protein